VAQIQVKSIRHFVTGHFQEWICRYLLSKKTTSARSRQQYTVTLIFKTQSFEPVCPRERLRRTVSGMPWQKNKNRDAAMKLAKLITENPEGILQK